MVFARNRRRKTWLDNQQIRYITIIKKINKVIFMKKIILLFTLLLMSLSSISFASSTQFNQPVYIGWYANTRAGGPSPAIAEGYDSKT